MLEWRISFVGRALHARPVVRRALVELLAVAAVTMPTGLGAMQPAPARLQPATASIDGEFTRIHAVRELADGRLLVTDQRQTMLAVIDWTTGRLQPVGREGRGPGEYRSTGNLHALGGDSTLMEDTRNGRWLLLDGARIVGTFEYAARRARALPNAVGADGRGHVLTVRPYAFRRADDGTLSNTNYSYVNADSILVALEHRASGRMDTVLRMRGGESDIRMLRAPVEPGAPPIPWYMGNPVAIAEQAMLFADGWIAAARRDPYRVDWRAPDGRWISGAPLPFVPVPMNDAQKRFATSRRFSAQTGFTHGDFPSWPAVLPPYPSDALRAAPDGQLVIRRMPDPTRPGTFYDVVDRTGRLTRRLALAENEHLVGIGARAAYVVVTDEMDVQTLRRHPWP